MAHDRKLEIKKAIRTDLVIGIYSLLFVVLGFWTGLPILLSGHLELITFKEVSFLVNISFSFSCILASVGTWYGHRYFGKLLGLTLLSLIIIYQGIRLSIEPESSPLLILSFLNFLVIFFAYEKIMPSKVEQSTQSNHFLFSNHLQQARS